MREQILSSVSLFGFPSGVRQIEEESAAQQFEFIATNRANDYFHQTNAVDPCDSWDY